MCFFMVPRQGALQQVVRNPIKEGLYFPCRYDDGDHDDDRFHRKPTHQGLKSTHDCRFDDGNHDDEKACRMKTFFVIETTNLS